MGIRRTPYAAGILDRASQLRLQSFAFKILLIVPISMAFAAQRQVPLLGAAAYFCVWYSVFSGLAALVQRHKWSAGCLTAWDEMAAFLGLALAARVLASLTG